MLSPRKTMHLPLILRTLSTGGIDIVDVRGDLGIIHSFREYGVLTWDNGLVVTISDGKRITMMIQ